MATFHVYVDGPDGERTPDTIRSLAEAISRRYGLPTADLITRLTAGRFRVKANVDKVTAEAYVRALIEVGARASIESAQGEAAPEIAQRRTSSGSMAPTHVRTSSPSQPPPIANPVRATAPPPTRTPAPAGRAAQPSVPPSRPSPLPASPTRPPANAAAKPPSGSSRSGASLPPTTRPATPLTSGLAAAFTEQGPGAASDFGALGGDSLSLASLDGNDDSPPAAAFKPPAESEPAKAAAATANKAKPVDTPVDLFAPPDAAEEAAFKVELAADEIEHRAKKMSTPPVGVAIPKQSSSPVLAPTPSTPAYRKSNPSIQPPAIGGVSAAPSEIKERARLAAGVVLSILLGFVPAHIIASMREDSSAKAIDAEIETTQNAVDSPETYAALDAFRSAKLSQKKSERRNIAIFSIVIWAAGAAGIAFVYFRKIPWDKLGKSA